MKLIMACSADGFFAKGPDDDMTWTGTTDKRVFQLLTRTSGAVCLAGRKTFQTLPVLPHRRVVPLSYRFPHVNNVKGEASLAYTLHDAYRWFGHDCWLIGGVEVAKDAIQGNLVSEAVICRSRYIELGEGMGQELHAELRGRFNWSTMPFGSSLSIEIYRKGA